MGRIKFVLTAMLMGIVCAPPSVQAAGTVAVLKEIRVIKSGDTLGIEISADKDLEYTCYKLPEFYRIVVDLPRTEPGRPDTAFKVKSTMISTIKIQKKRINDVPTTRVSVYLDEDADYTVKVDPADKRKLTVYFSKAAPAPAAGAMAPKQEKPSTVVPSAGEKLPVPAAPSSKPMSKKNKRAGSTFYTMSGK